MKRRAFVASAVTLLLARRGRADDPGAAAATDALLAEIARARKDIRTLRASFTQERTMKLLAATIKSTGQLAFIAPDRLRWELAAPDDVVYWVGPEGLSYRTRSSQATLPAGAAGSANVGRGLADLRALLGGDLAGLRDRYTLSATRGPGEVVVDGAAKDKTASVRAFTLTLDKGLVLPVRAHLVEGRGDAVDITFANAIANGPISPALMKP